MNQLGEYAIFVNGSYGVGKTSALDCVGNLLAAEGRAFSLLDIDWFHRSWPVADHDPDNNIIEAQNIAAVWSNYRSAGRRQLVLSGVIASHDDAARYSAAVGLPIRSVRLIADKSILEARLRRRYHATRGSELQWHLDRYAELVERQAKANQDELEIATDHLDPAAVARLILQHFNEPSQ